MDEIPASAALMTDVCAAAAAPARTSAADAPEPNASPPHVCAPENEALTASGLRDISEIKSRKYQKTNGEIRHYFNIF